MVLDSNVQVSDRHDEQFGVATGDDVSTHETGGIHAFNIHIGTLGHGFGALLLLAIAAWLGYRCMRGRTERRAARREQQRRLERRLRRAKRLARVQHPAGAQGPLVEASYRVAEQRVTIHDVDKAALGGNEPASGYAEIGREDRLSDEDDDDDTIITVTDDGDDGDEPAKTGAWGRVSPSCFILGCYYGLMNCVMALLAFLC